MKPSKDFPAGLPTLSPYLPAHHAGKLIEFLVAAFGCTEVSKTMRDDGAIANAQLSFGDSIIMLSEASEQFPAMPASFYLYVDNADASYRKALALGASSVMEPIDTHYADRNAGVRDMAGNIWWLAHRL